MAKHQVLADMGSFDVGMVDVIFSVVRNGSRLGRLKVSQGGIEWQQGGDKKRVYQMTWNKLDLVFLENARPVRKALKHKPLRHRRV